MSLIGNIVDKWETKSVKMADLVSIYFGESNREHGNDVAYAYAHFLECWVDSSNKMQEYQSCCLDTTFYLGVRLREVIEFGQFVVSQSFDMHNKQSVWLYRGVTRKANGTNFKCRRFSSWTRDYDVARSFADFMGTDAGDVVVGKFEASQVFASYIATPWLFNSNNVEVYEFEFVVFNPTKTTHRIDVVVNQRVDVGELCVGDYDV